jgi:hypothetical protein
MSTRREVLQALLTSIGAGAVMPGVSVPGLSAQHPISHHVADALAVQQADTNAQVDAYKPQFLDAHQFETLVSLSERVVPGSTRARVSEFIDQLLAVGASDDQRGFLNALGTFEGQAIARAARPWKQLTDADQIAILTDASTMAAGKPAQSGSITLREHFDVLKGWIAGAYYSSEIGMRELGWTGNAFYREFPGCEHAGGHP